MGKEGWISLLKTVLIKHMESAGGHLLHVVCSLLSTVIQPAGLLLFFFVYVSIFCVSAFRLSCLFFLSLYFVGLLLYELNAGICV